MWLIDLDGDLWNLDQVIMSAVFDDGDVTMLVQGGDTPRRYKMGRLEDIDSRAFLADLARALDHAHATNKIVIDSREFESCREYIKSRTT